MGIKSVEITFENVDYIEIPIEYFSKIDIRCNFVEFILKESVNSCFEGFKKDLDMRNYVGETLFDRIINYCDIVEIKIIHNDYTAETYRVEWEESDNCEYENKLQKACLSDDENLCVNFPTMS